MERLCQPPSEPAFVLYREQPNTAPLNGAKFVVNASHRETHFFVGNTSHGETHFYLTGADDEKRTSQNKRSRYD